MDFTDTYVAGLAGKYRLGKAAEAELRTMPPDVLKRIYTEAMQRDSSPTRIVPFSQLPPPSRPERVRRDLHSQHVSQYEGEAIKPNHHKGLAT